MSEQPNPYCGGPAPADTYAGNVQAGTFPGPKHAFES